MAVGVEYVDKAMPGTLDVVVLGRILQRVGDEQIAVDQGDAEGRVAGRHPRIGERPGQLRGLELGIEHIDRGGAKIGRVQEHSAGVGRERQTLVDGAAATFRVIDFQDCAGEIHRRIPRGYGPVLGCEDEQRGQLLRPDEEGERAGVENHAGGRRQRARCGDLRRWDRHNQRNAISAAIIQSRHAGGVVGDPEGPAREVGDTPGVLQMGVGLESGDGSVGHQIGLTVGEVIVVGARRAGHANDCCGSYGRDQSALECAHCCSPALVCVAEQGWVPEGARRVQRAC